MKTKIEEKPLDEFLCMFDRDVHTDILSKFNSSGVTAVVCFENLDMDSSQLGARTAVIVGPECTYKDVEACQGQHLGDVPSRFQWPVVYCRKESFNAFKKAADGFLSEMVFGKDGPPVMPLLDVVDIDPQKCGGVPVLKGTRVKVSLIIAELADGGNINELAEDMNLNKEDLKKLLECIATEFDSKRS